MLKILSTSYSQSTPHDKPVRDMPVIQYSQLFLQFVEILNLFKSVTDSDNY